MIGSTEWWLATLATHGAEISSVKREKYAAVLGKLEWEPRHFDDVEDTKAQLRLAQIPEAGIRDLFKVASKVRQGRPNARLNVRLNINALSL